MTGRECPVCGERDLPFEGCLCPLHGERCQRCGLLIAGYPKCDCPDATEDDDHADLEERRREWQARDAAGDDGRDW